MSAVGLLPGVECCVGKLGSGVAGNLVVEVRTSGFRRGGSLVAAFFVGRREARFEITVPEVANSALSVVMRLRA